VAFAALASITGACASEAGRAGQPSTTTTTTERPVASEPPAATTSTTVALPPATPIGWRPCGGELECGRLAVPVSYDDPTGPTLELALVKNPADDPSQRIGSLLVNPGGPGASGVRRVARGFRISDEVGRRFDIVGFDPRGVGESSPIRCGAKVEAFRAEDLSPDTADEERALEAAARAVADECVATEGQRLVHYGTVDVVHDIEVIRRALGEDRTSFVGISYGTLLGQLWAEWYPRSVRALVLDGVVTTADDGATGSVEQAEGVDQSFEAIAAACDADPSCPLADDGGLGPAYDELARRIESGAVQGGGVGPTQLAYAAFWATYDRDTWAPFWRAVDAGLAGDLSGVAELAGSFTRLVEYAPFAIVSCLDGPHPEGYAAWQKSAEGLAERSPRFGRVLGNELLPCAFWPAGTYDPVPVDAAGAPPILVVGSTGDAATPYATAVATARRLESGVLLTVELDGHVALGDSDCADAAITRYLVDLAVPARVLALRAAGAPVPAASVRYLLRAQTRSGGWSWNLGSEPDSNDTAAAIQALASVGSRGAPLRRAVVFLLRFQNPDGGFELTDGRGSDVQSTAWAVQALVAARVRPPASAFRYLTRMRRPDGSFRYSARYVATPVWVTAQALTALARKPLPLR
jgi:pimeloyl-ACP methyl ester carboxylesterase